MEGISADLIEEILVRLPVKSLLRFKRVCRSWRALIQSRRFIHRHYCHDNNQERLLFPWGEYVEGRFEKSGYNRLWLDYFRENKLHRIGPVYGLLCEVSFSGHIVLLNPATHKVKEIPPLPFIITHDIVTHLCFGFGLESPSGDYKIVVFDTRSAFAWVYNSISDCWKSIEGVFSWGIKSGSWELDAKFWNGVYYWMLVPKYGVDVILAFDMMTEEFRKFEAPPVSIAISAYGDSIAVMSGLGEGSDCVVWVMGKEGIWSECWRYRGTQERLLGLRVWKGEVLFWDDEDDNVVVVDVTTKEVRILASGYPRQFDHPLCYKESLLSIKGEQVARVFQDQGNLFLRI